MNAFVAKFTGLFSPVTLHDKPRAEPELLCSERNMTGFFTNLTSEQQERALNYKGKEAHGEDELRRR